MAHASRIEQMDPLTNIDELRCHIIGGAYNSARELNDITVELKGQLADTANDYLDRCRELARDAKGEPGRKSALLEGVLGHLSSYLLETRLRRVHRTSRGERSLSLTHHQSEICCQFKCLDSAPQLISWHGPNIASVSPDISYQQDPAKLRLTQARPQ